MSAGDWLPLAQRVLACEWVDRRGRDGWCETHDDLWPCGRAQEAADVLAEELDQPTKEQKMSKTTDAWTEHISAALSNAPTPIDPADIRPGDVVRIVREVTVEQVTAKDRGEAWLNLTWIASPGDTFLVSRPDPDAEAVEALAKLVYDISHPDADDLEASREALRDLREQGWDVVRRAES